MFFPEEPVASNRVWERGKSFCRMCDVRKQCLDLALKNETVGFRRYGLFGGMSPRERETYQSEMECR